jgi:cytoskeletal protein RodZ
MERQQEMIPMTTNYRVVPVRRTNVGLIVLGLVCLVVGLGFYLGWFTVSEHREAMTHSVNLNLRVDADKIKHDVRTATDKTEQKASQLSNKVKQEAGDLKSRTSPNGN